MGAFVNPDFATAGDGPGEAEGWELTAFLQLPGWAKFRAFGGFALEERFEDHASFARLWSEVEPFDADGNLILTISAVGTTPLNYFELPGNLLRILPESACFEIVGTTPGSTNLDAFWTVDSIEFDGTVTRYDPPRVLAHTWNFEGQQSEVTYELESVGDRVRLVLTHRKLSSAEEVLSVSGGWHAHLDILEDVLLGREPEAFWRTHTPIEAEYERRYSAR